MTKRTVTVSVMPGTKERHVAKPPAPTNAPNTVPVLVVLSVHTGVTSVTLVPNDPQMLQYSIHTNDCIRSVVLKFTLSLIFSRNVVPFELCVVVVLCFVDGGAVWFGSVCAMFPQLLCCLQKAVQFVLHIFDVSDESATVCEYIFGMDCL